MMRRNLWRAVGIPRFGKLTSHTPPDNNNAALMKWKYIRLILKRYVDVSMQRTAPHQSDPFCLEAQVLIRELRCSKCLDSSTIESRYETVQRAGPMQRSIVSS